MKVPSLPYRILALGPFRAGKGAVWTDDPVLVSRTDPDSALGEVGPGIHLSVPKELCPEGEIALSFSSFKDFHPDRMVQNHPFLKTLPDAKEAPSERPPSFKTPEGSTGRPGGRSGPKSPGLGNILEMVALPEENVQGSPRGRVRGDQPLDRLLQVIYADEGFRRLESTWRGLQVLLQQGLKSDAVELGIVPTDLEGLEETLEKMTEKLIRDLPSLILLDLPFDSSPRSIELLEKAATLSETLLVPSIAWVIPGFFSLANWGELGKLPYLPHHLEEPSFAKWRRFQKGSCAEWIVLTCNRFLSRYPYGPDNRARRSDFNEDQPLWISPVWAMGCLAGRSMAANGWPTWITDWNRVRLEDLALHAGKEGAALPTETAFSEERMRQFNRAGIVPLMSMPDRDIAFVPVERTAGGKTFGYQAVLSRVTQLILWAREHFDGEPQPRILEERLRKTFSLFWEESGHPAPDLEISAGRPDGQDRIPLHIRLRPSRSVLPSGEEIELSFFW